nr:GGDEF domain-containing protein [Oceanococcus sp. HetDA_MAG_MS8]
MNANAPPAPAMQPEDYRTLLNGLCVLHWSALVFAVVLEMILRTQNAINWPHWGHFGLLYNTIVVEFGVITVVLTALLRRSDWLERVPRTALGRLRWLLLSLLVLDGVHLVAFFHATGGWAGPIALFLPLVIMVIYLSLPWREATIANAGLAAALVGLTAGRQAGVFADQGALAAAFSDEFATPSVTVTCAAVLAAVIVGIVASRRMQKAGIGLHHGASYEPFTRLFTRPVLEGRIAGELLRLSRTQSSATLMLVEFNNLPQLLPHADYAGFNEVLLRFAATLRGVTREQGDTCARYDHSTFALLLPTADSKAAEVIARRIFQGADVIRAPSDSTVAVQVAVGAAVADPSTTQAPEAFLLKAKDALRSARNSGSGHQLVIR